MNVSGGCRGTDDRHIEKIAVHASPLSAAGAVTWETIERGAICT
jgi:hypothetical protein